MRHRCTNFYLTIVAGGMMENESIDIINKSSSPRARKVASSDDLTDLVGVMSHILKMTKQYILLDIRIDNKPETYKSIFMGVTAEGKTEGLIIGPLIPTDGNSLIKKSRKITVSYCLEGVIYTSYSRFLEINEIGALRIKLEIPTLIRKIKMRKAIRVSSVSLSPLKVDFGDGIAEEVVNISIGGLCFFTLRNDEVFQTGKTFSNTSFTHPMNKRKICTKAEARWFVKNAYTRGQVRNKCGIEFIGIKQADENAIARYVSER